jgi:hypothetical protein
MIRLIKRTFKTYIEFEKQIIQIEMIMGKLPKRSLRCKIGLHKWIYLANTSLYDEIEQCSRCQMGRHINCIDEGVIYYTPKTMKQAWDEGNIYSPAARNIIYGETVKFKE